MKWAIQAIFENGAFRPLYESPEPIEEGQIVWITVEPETEELEREDWLRLSMHGLAQAYSDDEPDYGRGDLKAVNPDYRTN